MIHLLTRLQMIHFLTSLQMINIRTGHLWRFCCQTGYTGCFHVQTGIPGFRPALKNQIIESHYQFTEPLPPFRTACQGYGDITPAFALHNGTVCVKLPPCSGFPVNSGIRTGGLQPFDKFVMNGRLSQDLFHLPAHFRRHQQPVFQHIVKPGNLQNCGAMGKVVQGVTLPCSGFAVFLAHPQTTVLGRIIKTVFGRTQQIFKKFRAYTVEHFGCCFIGGIADHLDKGFMGFLIQCHFPSVDALESTEQNGDFGKACCIHHLVAVKGGQSGRGRFCNINQSHAKVFVFNCLFQLQRGHRSLQTLLQKRVFASGQGRTALVGIRWKSHT